MQSNIYLLAGGPGSDRGHITTLLRDALHASHQPAPRIAYVGAASGDNASFFHRIGELFERAAAPDGTGGRTFRHAPGAWSTRCLAPNGLQLVLSDCYRHLPGSAGIHVVGYFRAAWPYECDYVGFLYCAAAVIRDGRICARRASGRKFLARLCIGHWRRVAVQECAAGAVARVRSTGAISGYTTGAAYVTV